MWIAEFRLPETAINRSADHSKGSKSWILFFQSMHSQGFSLLVMQLTSILKCSCWRSEITRTQHRQLFTWFDRDACSTEKITFTINGNIGGVQTLRNSVNIHFRASLSSLFRHSQYTTHVHILLIDRHGRKSEKKGLGTVSPAPNMEPQFCYRGADLDGFGSIMWGSLINWGKLNERAVHHLRSITRVLADPPIGMPVTLASLNTVTPPNRCLCSRCCQGTLTPRLGCRASIISLKTVTACIFPEV